MRFIMPRLAWGSALAAALAAALAVALAAALAVALAVVPSAGGETARGTITELNAAKRTFKLAVQPGQVLSCRLKADAEIRLDERRLEPVDLHVGDVVEVTYERAGEALVVSKVLVRPRSAARNGPIRTLPQPPTPLETRPPPTASWPLTLPAGSAAAPPRPVGTLPTIFDVPSGAGAGRLVEDAGAFFRQKAYYATDRQPVQASAGFPWQVLMLLSGAGLALAVLFWLISRASALAKLRTAPPYLLVAALAMLLTTLVGWWLSEAPSDQPEGQTFGKKLAGAIHYGYGWISIPKRRQAGDLPRPSILRAELKPNPERHVALLENHALSESAWLTELRETLQARPKKEIFVFIHGYSVSFEDALRRTGQLAFDLRLDGPAVLFSWPSQGGLAPYTVDENFADVATDHFQHVLEALAAQSGAETIHLLAHSMGNRVLAEALARLVDQRAAWLPTKIGELVLAAPDVDRDKFRNRYHSRLTAAGRRLTLYASASDRALEASRIVHGNPRAGDARPELLILDKMESIDVSQVDSGFLGHSYYGDEPLLLKDIRLILEGAKPAQRQWLRARQFQASPYWEMLP